MKFKKKQKISKNAECYKTKRTNKFWLISAHTTTESHLNHSSNISYSSLITHPQFIREKTQSCRFGGFESTPFAIIPTDIAFLTARVTT